MDWPAECAAIIPCLNEEPAIGSLVAAVRLRLPKVLVVDDGSRDQTAKVATQAGAIVLRHELNRGKGAALQAGWRWAREHGFKWALTMDGDGQHSPDDIPSFFTCAERTSTHLIVGDRMGNAKHMPWLRRCVNRWMSRRLSRAAGQYFPDSQCGFRLMDLEAWSAVMLTTSHFEIESELLLAFIARGYSVQFVPIRVIYKDEQSKIHPLLDTVRWLRWWRGTNPAHPKSNPRS
jgi:glycosyltransferase involved in cell wall biosynthesis